MPDLYQLLGVPRTATQAEIRRAFHALAERWHPDKAPPAEREEAEARFQALSAAYDVLKSPKRRAAYDAGGLGALGDAAELRELLDRLDRKVEQGLHLVSEIGQFGLQLRKVVIAVRTLLQW